MRLIAQRAFRARLQAAGIPAHHIHGSAVTTEPPTTGGEYPAREYGLMVYTCRLPGRDWWTLWDAEETEQFIAAYEKARDTTPEEYIEALRAGARQS